MATLDRHNIAKVYQDHLKSSLVEAVTKNIVESMVDDFRKNVEIIVKKEAEKISIEGLEIFQTHTDFREQFAIYLKWTDEREL